jgi:Arc/MetJ family transcription regulator
MKQTYVIGPGEATVALTEIDIDEDALTEAMRLSGAKTKKDAVKLALRESAARHRRVAALEHYAVLAVQAPEQLPSTYGQSCPLAGPLGR